jgi:hypothetical protein
MNSRTLLIANDRTGEDGNERDGYETMMVMVWFAGNID